MKEEQITTSFQLPKSLHEKLVATLPWGVKGHFFRKITEMALDSIQKGGPEAIGAILTGEFNPYNRGAKK